jgi:sarcosine oxidase subunit gamma
VCLRLEGPAVREVLANHVALDLDFREFPAGRFAQTGLDHAAVLLDRRADECFELYLLSTFAASAWDLLVDSALPYGYSLAVLSADGEAGASPA